MRLLRRRLRYNTCHRWGRLHVRARNESTKSLQAEVMLTGHGDGGVFERPWTKAYRRCFSTVQPAEIGVTSVTVLERELPENA